MMHDFFSGMIAGLLIGAVGVLFLIYALTQGNPTNTGKWVCTDWQIVNYQPECHVMTKQGNT